MICPPTDELRFMWKYRAKWHRTYRDLIWLTVSSDQFSRAFGTNITSFFRGTLNKWAFIVLINLLSLIRMEQSRQIMFLAKWNIEHTFCDGSEFKKLITRCSLSPISLSKSHENYAINKEYCQLTPNPRNDNFRICISCNGRLLPLAILSAAVNCSQWCTKTITLIWKNQ